MVPTMVRPVVLRAGGSFELVSLLSSCTNSQQQDVVIIIHNAKKSVRAAEISPQMRDYRMKNESIIVIVIQTDPLLDPLPRY